MEMDDIGMQVRCTLRESRIEAALTGTAVGEKTRQGKMQEKGPRTKKKGKKKKKRV